MSRPQTNSTTQTVTTTRLICRRQSFKCHRFLNQIRMTDDKAMTSRALAAIDFTITTTGSACKRQDIYPHYWWTSPPAELVMSSDTALNNVTRWRHVIRHCNTHVWIVLVISLGSHYQRGSQKLTLCCGWKTMPLRPPPPPRGAGALIPLPTN